MNPIARVYCIFALFLISILINQSLSDHSSRIFLKEIPDEEGEYEIKDGCHSCLSATRYRIFLDSSGRSFYFDTKKTSKISEVYKFVLNDMNFHQNAYPILCTVTGRELVNYDSTFEQENIRHQDRLILKVKYDWNCNGTVTNIGGICIKYSP